MTYDDAKQIVMGAVQSSADEQHAAMLLITAGYADALAAQKAALPPYSPPWQPAARIIATSVYTTDVAIFFQDLWIAENNFHGYVDAVNLHNAVAYKIHTDAYIAWRPNVLGGTANPPCPPPPMYQDSVGWPAWYAWWQAGGSQVGSTESAPVRWYQAAIVGTFDYAAFAAKRAAMLANQNPGSIAAHNPTTGV